MTCEVFNDFPIAFVSSINKLRLIEKPDTSSCASDFLNMPTVQEHGVLLGPKRARGAFEQNWVSGHSLVLAATRGHCGTQAAHSPRRSPSSQLVMIPDSVVGSLRGSEGVPAHSLALSEAAPHKVPWDSQSLARRPHPPNEFPHGFLVLLCRWVLGGSFGVHSDGFS